MAKTIVRVTGEDKERVKAALAFYIDRCNWAAEPEEKAEYERLLGELEGR